MPDPIDKGTTSAADEASSGEGHSAENKKTCADCGTSKTPLWRGGPAGPKSLCNACGIKSRKKRRVFSLSSKVSEEVKKPKKSCISGSSTTTNSNRTSKTGLVNPWKGTVLGVGTVFVGERRQHRRKLGEVEQAAALLMTLSYGSSVNAR
ncbi:hypothetical protein SAY87_011920 [Trapa incisa]|uniref:GATA-type domain-containing protein n=1 Tax=Trapa incisa TaxID=236973 RepID=A0AAN7GRH9_9MYRT|nr:hypothetical protein SAY87_011920 [Trapa incisa]